VFRNFLFYLPISNARKRSNSAFSDTAHKGMVDEWSNRTAAKVLEVFLGEYNPGGTEQPVDAVTFNRIDNNTGGQAMTHLLQGHSTSMDAGSADPYFRRQDTIPPELGHVAFQNNLDQLNPDYRGEVNSKSYAQAKGKKNAGQGKGRRGKAGGGIEKLKEAALALEAAEKEEAEEVAVAEGGQPPSRSSKHKGEQGKMNKAHR
jgi:hypothetical protein